MTEYVEDPEWVKQIQNLTCPYGEHDLIKPHQSKRQCTNPFCGFEVHGDPKLTAYKIKPEKIEPTNESKCPECGFEVKYEVDRRETVCQSPVCGLVVKGSGHYCGGVKVDYPYGHHYENEIKDDNNQVIYSIL